MQFRIPDDIVIKAQANITDISMAVAVEFYADNRIDHADACRLASASAERLPEKTIGNDRGMLGR